MRAAGPAGHRADMCAQKQSADSPLWAPSPTGRGAEQAQVSGPLGSAVPVRGHIPYGGPSPAVTAAGSAFRPASPLGPQRRQLTERVCCAPALLCGDTERAEDAC